MNPFGDSKGDQLTRAEQYDGPDSGDFAGAAEYSWCLSCDSALSERREYNAAGECISWQRYEYDGLQLLRRDERYDADADNAPYIDATGTVDSGENNNSPRRGGVGAKPGLLV